MFEPPLLCSAVSSSHTDVQTDVAERQYHRDEKEQSERQRQEQLEQFRKQYAGLRDETEKTKKMKQKAERAKYRFQFDWSKEDDTSRDANPLYDAKHDVKLLFGRGTIAGVDARMQMEQNHKFQSSMGRRGNVGRIITVEVTTIMKLRSTSTRKRSRNTIINTTEGKPLTGVQNR